MVFVTKEQAICMFFCDKFSNENATKWLTNLDNLPEVDICYMTDPKEPLLIHKNRLCQDPFQFHEYPSSKESSSSDKVKSSEEDFALSNMAQLLQFLNMVYLAEDPSNEHMYEVKSVTMKQILVTVWEHSNLLNDKSINSFGRWCATKKLNFMNAPNKRKLNENHDRVHTRCLYVLKPQYIDNAAHSITSYLPIYQDYIKSLEKQGYVMVGYVRKSPSKESPETRIRLLRSMCQKLKERSRVKTIFASVCCKANDVLIERDMDDNAISSIVKELGIAGSMQDMLSFITRQSKVCLVALDHAGITTNKADLAEFLSNNQQIEKLVIDRLPFTNKVEEYDCSQLLDDEEKLNDFDCRQRAYQRSK
ncbi:hypothetical protein DM01DRAFT_1322371 [Hesseltinella vesiculosa]|uniref:Uncharacterized protein n=1 Tax=Hesseltinella vesiculosa TaxID=101127 RepID=A0A1X2G8C7_9FUNG|nr:hypothetical protein DM01DRAFT_1326773 [Hesseltinella vesiculosa]ORX54154.1 hypothetical protein DM01DRAFT_1322371 [Hesseltinella vesiculosa]